jgi:hypothetical protein
MRLMLCFAACLCFGLCVGGCSPREVRCDEHLLPINAPAAPNADHGPAAAGSAEKVP